MPKAAIRGSEIYYEVTGTGRPLVYVAGQGTGPEARLELVASLSLTHAVLTYDQRGTGRSQRQSPGQAIEEHAEDLLALMDVVGFQTADFIGHSTGTGSATRIAAKRPRRVRKLVLAAPWTHADAYLLDVQQMRKAAASCMPPDQYAQLNAHLLYSAEYRRRHHDRFSRLAAEASAAPLDVDGFSARLDAILAFDARPLYPKVVCPTLAIGIRDDLIMPAWFAEEAARAISGSKLLILSVGGHMFPETQTSAFVDAVVNFLG